jgi:biotin carboxylase
VTRPARTLLILGAGESQVPTYLEARRLGYQVVGVDRRADAEARPLCDRFLPLSTADPAGILAALGDAEPAGVMAPASDPSVPVQRRLGLAYGTPFVTPEAAVRASSDKAWFRGLLERLGLPRYGWVDGSAEVEVAAKAARLRMPVIVKPVDAAGSRGVVFVREEVELVDAVRQAKAWSPGGRVIVEEFVTGQHYSVEAFLEDGRAAVMAVSERTVTGPPSFITVSHLLPAELDQGATPAVRRQVELVCAAIGLRQGPVNLDLVVDHRGEVYLIELGARLGGNGLGRLVARTLGVNLVEAAIRLAVGDRCPLRARRRRPGRRAGMVYALHAPHRGVLAAVEGVQAARRIPEVQSVELHATVGSAVLPFDQSANKLGYLTLAGESPAQLRSALTRALAVLRFDIRGAAPCTSARQPGPP